jgi:glycerol kinase
VTDVTNASRKNRLILIENISNPFLGTMLMNIRNLQWDADLCQ